MASSIFKMVLMRIFGCKYFVASGTRLLPPVNEVCGNVICLQVCICPQGGAIPACIAGGIPVCLAAGLQRGAVPVCIAGGIPACLAAGLGGGLQAHTQGGS